MADGVFFDEDNNLKWITNAIQDETATPQTAGLQLQDEVAANHNIFFSFRVPTSLFLDSSRMFTSYTKRVFKAYYKRVFKS